MKKIFFIILLILLCLNLIQANPKQELLGVRKVNFRAEQDTIVVTAAEGVFTKIRFEVEGNAVAIHKLVIEYGNGDKDEIPVKLVFKKGDMSRIVDLEGNQRIIKRITFWYESIGKKRKGKATLKVFGIR